MFAVGFSTGIAGLAAVQFVDADPSRDHREVGCEVGVSAELPQDFVILGDDLEEDLRGNVLDVGGVEAGAAEVGGVLHHVVNHGEETIDEIVPGSWLLGQTALQQVAVDGQKCHGDDSGEAGSPGESGAGGAATSRSRVWNTAAILPARGSKS